MPVLGPQGTYKWLDVCTTASQLVHSIPVAPLQLYAADQINSIIWKTFPWRWTLNSLAPMTLVNGQQDYVPVPADFWKWINPYLVRTDVTPPQYQPIKTAKHLAIEVQRQGGINTIQAVSYEPTDGTNGAFRLDITPEISGTIVMVLAGDYQTLPPKVTGLGQVMAIHDSYFQVALEGVLWMFYRLADDPRAGVVSINRAGDKESSGQLGVFQTALEEMKRMEDGADDMQTRFPEQPLGWSRTGNPGIFPV